jgi:hypothetical protein
VEGFGSPPTIMTTYNPAYYPGLMTEAGLRRCQTMVAYTVVLDDSRLVRLERLGARALASSRGLTIRPVDTRALARDVAKMQDVFNAAWGDNWGHVPMTPAEVDFMARRLRPLIDATTILLAETGDETVAFILAVPDFNEALGRLRGRLVSPRLALILPYLAGFRRPRTTRVVAMGVRREYRQRGIEAALFAPCLRAMLRGGYQRCELSWILEDNVGPQRFGDMFGGTVSRRYALYEGAV